MTHLLPELFEMQEVQDHDELKTTAKTVLVGLAGLPYPEPLVEPVLRQLIGLLRDSTSWRVRLDVLPIVQGSRGS